MDPRQDPVTTPADYREAFLRGGPVRVAGLCGRVLRGRAAEDFRSLGDDPGRRVVMLMGSDGLEHVCGRPGRSVLRGIGYTEEYVDRLLAEGTRFGLVVLPEVLAGARLATWDAVVDVAAEVYPEVAGALLAQREALKSRTVEELETLAGRRFADSAGGMTAERFANGPQGLVNTRAFLYHTVQLRDLFSGDGFTYRTREDRDAERNPVLREYVVRNRPLGELPGHVLVDLDVAPSPQAPDPLPEGVATDPPTDPPARKRRSNSWAGRGRAKR